MVVDIEKIKQDIRDLENKDIEAEVAERIANIRQEVIDDRDDQINDLKFLLEKLEEYELAEEEECEEEEEESCEEIPTTVEE